MATNSQFGADAAVQIVKFAYLANAMSDDTTEQTQ